MPDPDAFETPDSPPPPAYELCQQEFDEKIARALEASRRDQAERDSQLPAIDTESGEGEWEVWSDTVFAAAAERLTLLDDAQNGSSGPSSACGPSALDRDSVSRSHNFAEAASGLHDIPAGGIRPLRIHTKQPSAKEKERPSWYVEVQPEEGSSANPTSASSAGNSVWPENTPSGRSTPRTLPEKTPTPERVPTPPPEFTEVGPDLDGPPYEAYQPEPTRGRGVVLTYVPGDSNPPSPLASPTIPQMDATFSTYVPSVSPSPTRRRRLPTPPTSRAIPVPILSAPAPVSSQSDARATLYDISDVRPRYGNPRVVFDPRVAYTGTSDHSNQPHREGTNPSYKANAAPFYNASVSSSYPGGRHGSAPPQRVPASVPMAHSWASQVMPAPRPQLLTPQPSVPIAQHTNYLGLLAGRSTSPAPSVRSMQTTYTHHTTHSLSSQSYPSHSYTHLPMQQQATYQPTPSQQTSYQPTSYQPTSYHPAQQPSSYQPSSYQPSSYHTQTSSYQPTTYNGR